MKQVIIYVARIAVGAIIVALIMFAYVIISQAQEFRPTQIKTDVNTQRDRGQHVNVEEFNKVKTDLDRLAGPICEFDGKRAIEHIKFYKENGNKFIAFYDYTAPHDKVNATNKWVTNWIQEHYK